MKVYDEDRKRRIEGIDEIAIDELNMHAIIYFKNNTIKEYQGLYWRYFRRVQWLHVREIS